MSPETSQGLREAEWQEGRGGRLCLVSQKGRSSEKQMGFRVLNFVCKFKNAEFQEMPSCEF